MEWTWLGDHFALDVANTVILRRGHYVDLLETPADLTRWSNHETGRLLVPLPSSPTGDQLARFLAIRNHVIELGRAAVAERPPPRESVDAVNAAVVSLPLVSGLSADARTARPLPPMSADPIDVLVAQAAAAIIDLLTGPQRNSLALCPAPSCGQFFLEARPNQQWCSKPCGNRARAARHAAR